MWVSNLLDLCPFLKLRPNRTRLRTEYCVSRTSMFSHNLDVSVPDRFSGSIGDVAGDFEPQSPP